MFFLNDIYCITEIKITIKSTSYRGSGELQLNKMTVDIILSKNQRNYNKFFVDKFDNSESTGRNVITVTWKIFQKE
jgi:hypothetical protein